MPMLCLTQDGSELGKCEPVLEEKGRGKDLVGSGGRMWQRYQHFPFPLPQK